jgi:hypothetical protein
MVAGARVHRLAFFSQVKLGRRRQLLAAPANDADSAFFEIKATLFSGFAEKYRNFSLAAEIRCAPSRTE